MPIGSWKLIMHTRWDFFAPVNSTGPQGRSQNFVEGGKKSIICFLIFLFTAKKTLKQWDMQPQ